MSRAAATGPLAERALWAAATGKLDDFRPLLPAEEEVIARLPTGTYDRLGDGSRPDGPDPKRRVRASFLRFLMLGGEEGCRPHEKGIRITGAWIEGVLDLEACHVTRDIGLIDCRFETTPILRAAIINRLFLDGSAMPGLQAERVDVRGGIYLRRSELDGGIVLAQARLGSNLECDGIVVRAAGGWALDAEGIELRNLLLRGAELRGGINLAGATLSADLDLAGTVIETAAGPAVDAHESGIRGSVILRQAQIAGEFRFVAGIIGGDLDASGARLANPGGPALELSRATVGGAFFLRRGAAVDGVLALTGASLGTIHDEAACWPAAGNLLLNRCRYSAFIDAPVDAARRLDWLSRQHPERWGEDFWPQPYEQLAQVFREMGHGEHASVVLIVKERLQRRARRARAHHPLWRAWLAATDAVLAATVRYGRRPLLALVWLILFWLAGSLVFMQALYFGAIKPNSAVVLRAPEWTMCGIAEGDSRLLASAPQPTPGRQRHGETQLDCFLRQPETTGYPAFSPWMYSLDTLLPVLDMGQRSFWRPNPDERGGRLALGYFYFQSLVGWALSLLAVAGFSGLVKSA